MESQEAYDQLEPEEPYYEPDEEAFVRPATGFWALGGKLTWIAGGALALSAFTGWYAGPNTSGPTLALVVEGEGAIATLRKTIGATNPADAEAGSIRGDLASAMPDNLVHGSDSPESAAREVALWFSDDELV